MRSTFSRSSVQKTSSSKIQTPCSKENLKRAALFSALTGLRFGDIQALTWEKLEHQPGEGYYLNFTMRKTEGIMRLPISELLVPEEEDISLKERVRRVNAASSATPSCPVLPPSCPTRSGISPAPTGHPNVILISIHVNAAGDGSKWMNATGWSCYTTPGQTQSDTLANCLYEAAIKNFPGRRIRTDYSDKDPDWEENFYLLRKSLCPAVLSENYFMDNKSDLEYLQSW